MKLLAAKMIVLKSCVGVFLFFGIVYCIKVVPERARVLFANPDYVENTKFFVSRHGRKSGYYFNIDGDVLRPWTNNITIHLIAYEYLHNEYRRSFVEMQLLLCDFLNEAYIGGMLKNVGVSCPVLGEYHLRNMSVITENFHYVMPFEKYRVDAYINITKTRVPIVIAEVYCHVGK